MFLLHFAAHLSYKAVVPYDTIGHTRYSALMWLWQTLCWQEPNVPLRVLLGSQTIWRHGFETTSAELKEVVQKWRTTAPPEATPPAVTEADEATAQPAAKRQHT